VTERPGDAVARAPFDIWRPTRSLTSWLTGLLVVQAVGSVVAPIAFDQSHRFVQWHRAFDALLDGRQQEADRIFRAANESSDATSWVGLVGTATFVLLIIWMWRSAHNAQALGRTSPRLSPGWAIGSWFIPVGNVVLPYVLYSDLWRSSDPASERGDGWRTRPGSALVRGFWAVYVVGISFALAGPVLAITGVTGQSATHALLVAAGAVSAVACLLEILVIREITDRQEALQARDPAPTERVSARVPAAPIVPDRPGWYADPGDQFDHRYWDGTGWTEHVSRAGVPDTAPVAPADWYPDPTRRFPWRYWTGSEWTEHVSRNGDLFVDPLGGDATGSRASDPGT